MLIITIIIFLAVLIITHEFGHFITAKLFKVRVDEFAFGFPPKIFSKKIGETLYSLNAIPFGGFVKLYGESEEGADPNEKPERSFYHQKAWKRAVVIAAGVAMNFIVGWFAFTGLAFFNGIPSGDPLGVYIKEVNPGSPAAEAGLMPGEKLEGFKNIEEFQSYVGSSAGSPVAVNDKTVVPADDGSGKGRIGVVLEEKYNIVQFNFLESISAGFMQSVLIIKEIYLALGGLLAGLFAGSGQVLDSLTGPVGIFNEIGRASESGVVYLVQLLAILSLNLAVFNLLPFPALDGGRMLFIIIEAIIGKRMNVKYEALANIIGFALLILLAITVTVNDIYKLTL